MMRIPALLVCCLCLFLGGLAAGCGTHKTTKTGWETVTINGKPVRVRPITGAGTFTLTVTP